MPPIQGPSSAPDHAGSSIKTSYFDWVLPLIRLEGRWSGPDLDPAVAEERLIDPPFDPSLSLDGQPLDGDQPQVKVKVQVQVQVLLLPLRRE